MKKNSGFTLIELLATIIILAGIALVAFPILLNTIKDSEEKIDKTTEKIVINAAKLYVDGNLNEYPKKNGNTYCITLKKLINGSQLSEDMVNVNNKNHSSTKTVKVTVTDDYDYKIVNNDECKYNAYANGYAIYYDIATGKKCDNYHKDNSRTGYNGYTNKIFDKNTKTYDIKSEKIGSQNTCLKFYVFNDSTDSDTLKLLLDHNSTGMIPWNSGGFNSDGMKEVIDVLKSDTNEWIGTEQPSLFEDINPSTNEKIDYTGYKARLITAAEVAKITGKEDFDSDTTQSCYKFETLEYSPFGDPIRSYLEQGQAKYAWLFDYITHCTYRELDGKVIKSGCNYDAPWDYGDYNWGYWTSTAINDEDYSGYAWVVEWDGIECISEVEGDYDDGVRPVIEVKKENL